MIPNKWVIFWDNVSVGLYKQNVGHQPVKTEDPHLIYYWETKEAAEKFMDMWPERYWTVHEIQFRIVK